MIKVGVVIPTLNNKSGGYEALHSIKGTDKIFWTPIIMDNWRTKSILSASWNNGILQAKDIECDLVLVINDDVLLAPHTLQGLVESWMQKQSGVVMITGQNIRNSFDFPDQILKYQCPLNEDEVIGGGPDFSCFLTSPEILDIVGKFDENFIPAYFEDNDYHRRIDLLGYKAVSSSWAHYYHYGSTTQNYIDGQPVVMPFEFEQNRNYYSNKWGGEPGKETYTNPYNDPTLTPAMWLPNMR